MSKARGQTTMRAAVREHQGRVNAFPYRGNRLKRGFSRFFEGGLGMHGNQPMYRPRQRKLKGYQK
jgi:hypothetical protein